MFTNLSLIRLYTSWCHSSDDTHGTSFSPLSTRPDGPRAASAHRSIREHGSSTSRVIRRPRILGEMTRRDRRAPILAGYRRLIDWGLSRGIAPGATPIA